MAINIKFDVTGNPEPPSIILATKNGNKLGLLNVNADSIELNDKLKISEISFTLNKYIDGKLNNLWDKVVDFKLVWCKEWDCWFEIKVELDEATETVKTVFGTQLGQAELSQIMVYNMEVNTEEDIARDDYKITILYDENDHEASLLHRILKDKAPHYSIAYVDPTIARIQKQFSWDGSSICDVLDEVEEEIGCLVIYNSNSTEGGIPNRSISVYDLEQNCNDCGHRGEFTDECPKCGSKNIEYGYGEDTAIFVTNDELASEGIQLVVDTDSVKNCFKLEAGDDLMTATIRNCNPNGCDYIWRFSNDIKEDMSDELVEKLESYDTEYKRYYNEYESNLDAALLTQYNSLVEKYDDFYNTDSTCLNCDNKGKFYDKCPSCNSENLLMGKELQKISTPIVGYPALMNAYYNTIDFALYLESGLMPSITMSGTTAEEQASLLTTSSLSPVAVNVKEASSISSTTADSAVLSMAKVIVRSTYKVEILSSSLSTEKKWSGTFKITNYSDDTDTVEVVVNDIEVNNNAETFIKQKIEKALNKEDTDDYSISGLFEKEYDEFCTELTKYALNPLQSFYNAADACISILTEQGAGDETNKPDLYENLYLPYFQKQEAIASEISIRKNELAIIEGVYDEATKTTSGGLQNNIRNCQSVIQDALNFEDYLGESLWKEFCSFRREDKYSNSNYISDGLNNAQLFERALEFFDVAENEIYKSSELQHSISTSLNNLLAIDKFKPLVKYFKNGNWIRVRVDDKIYKLRLLEYDINFGSFKSIPVEFSDVTKIKNSTTDVKNVLEQASSVASSYDAVTRQAKKGNVAKSTIEQWLDEGLNAANVQIQSNDSEEIIITKNGLLGRSYDDITGTYSPEQLKITHNIMAYTDDNWETVSSALGKHNYKKWDGSSFVDDEGYGLTSKFVTAGYIAGSQIIGGEILSSNYDPKTKGTYINLLNGDFDFAGGKIVYDSSDNEVKLKGVTIQWTGDDGVNAPEVKVENITGLDKYLDQLEDLEDQLDGRVQTYSQSEDPSTSWTNEEKAKHIGDLWINSDSGITKRWTGTEWVEVTDSDLKELAESKAQIFTDTPTPPYYIGDLWVQGSTGDIKHCIKNSEADATEFVESDWVISSKYTDDTEAIKAWNYADEAKKTGDRLVTGLGFQPTEITGNYIISPSIAGGYLNIINTTNNTGVVIDPNGLVNDDYIFRVYNGSTTAIGLDVDGNAEFSGTINGSHFIGGDLIIGDKDKVGDYAEIANDGTLTCTNVDILGGTLKIGRYEAKYEDGTPQLDEDGNQLYGWNTWIDENGILKTNESVISGTMYAGAGSIGGFTIEPIKDENGDTVGGWLYSGGKTLGDNKSIFLSATDMSGTVSNTESECWRVTIGEHFGVTNDGTAYMSNCEITGGSLRLGTQNSGYYAWISEDGVLNAGGANIDGTINAVEGNIGGWHITTNALYKNISGISSGMCSMQTNVVFSEGLSYTLNSDENSYTVSGIGSCIDANVVIPNIYNDKPVTTIGVKAFEYCGSLTSIEIPDSVTSIGNGAFYNCGSLKSIEIPDSVTSIKYNAFRNCSSLKSITIGNGVTSIDNYAFMDCSSLTSVVIGDGVTTIGHSAFSGCSSLTSVSYAGSENDWNKITIGLGNSYLENAARYYNSLSVSISNCDSLVNSGNFSPPRFFAGSVSNIPTCVEDAKFLVLEDGSLYASAVDIKGRIEADNGNIGGLTIQKDSISSGTDGLTFLPTGLVIAQQLEINDYFKANTLQIGKISGRYNTSSYLDFEGADRKMETVAATVASNVTNEGSTHWLTGNIEDAGSVTLTITTDKALTDAKTFVITAVHYNINLAANPSEETFVYETINITIPTGGNVGTATVVNIKKKDGYTCYFDSSRTLVSPSIYEQYSMATLNSIKCCGTFSPIEANSSYQLGSSDYRWKEIWCQTTLNTVSDRNEKNSIEILSQKYDFFFDELKPVRYKFNQNESDRYHVGFIAQDVADALNAAEIPTSDFAGYLAYKKEDGSMGYGLRYGEFIALNTYEVQKLKKRVEELEIKLNELSK